MALEKEHGLLHPPERQVWLLIGGRVVEAKWRGGFGGEATSLVPSSREWPSPRAVPAAQKAMNPQRTSVMLLVEPLNGFMGNQQGPTLL